MSNDTRHQDDNDAQNERSLRTGILALAISVLVGWWLIYPSTATRSSETRLVDSPLRVGYAIEPPYAFLDDQGQLQGESIDVLRHVLQEEHITDVVWLHVEFGDLLHELKHGRIDIIASGMFDTPERRIHALFTRPTARVRAALLVRVDLPPTFQLKDLTADATHRVVVIDGSVEQQTLVSLGWTADRIHPAADAEAAMDTLESGMADMLALSLPSVRWQLKRREIADRYRIIELPEVPPGYPAFAVGLDNANLKRRIDQVLATYIGSPAHVRNVQSYGFEWADVVWPASTETTP
ncbi:MAG: transporter substrate-binding domain-containing protein [Lysobacteraceae bacterium]